MSDQKAGAQEALDTLLAATADSVRFLQEIVNGEHGDKFAPSVRVDVAKVIVQAAAELAPALKAVRPATARSA